MVSRNRLAEAEQQLWNVLREQPNQVWALKLMGSVRLRQKRNAEAEALFRRAVELSSKDVQAWRSLGEVYSAEDQGEKAIDAYSVAVRLFPADAAESLTNQKPISR